MLEIPIPHVVNATDVLVRILFSGITYDDIQMIDGVLPCRTDKPFIMGTEMSGKVIGVGVSVIVAIIGDYVAINPYYSCLTCDFCRSGTPNLCQQCKSQKVLGLYEDGGWTEYIVVQEAQIFKLNGIPVELGVLLPMLSTVVYAMEMIEPLQIHKRIFIIGAGMAGLIWIALLHHKGYRNVIVSEPNVARYEVIQQMDVNYEVIAPNMVTSRIANDPTFFFDLIIDCSSCSNALQQAFDLLDSGGKIVMFGKQVIKSKISISPFELQRREGKVVAITLGVYTYPTSLVVLKSLAGRYLSYERLGIKNYPLKKYKMAVDHVRKKTVVKAVFRMPEDCICVPDICETYTS